jgi:hypothetical protein
MRLSLNQALTSSVWSLSQSCHMRQSLSSKYNNKKGNKMYDLINTEVVKIWLFIRNGGGLENLS